MTIDEKRSLQIENALRSLGVSPEYVEYESTDIDGCGDRAKVYVDGEYFGIYDFVRETFVD